MSSSNSEMNHAKAAHEFHLEEYKRLVEEIQTIRQSASEFERYAIFAMAAFYAWYFSLSSPAVGHFPLLHYAPWIPVMLSILGVARAYLARRSILSISQYVSKIEDMYSLAALDSSTTLQGWEHLAQTRRTGWRGLIPNGGGPAVSWALILAVTVAIALSLP